MNRQPCQDDATAGVWMHFRLSESILNAAPTAGVLPLNGPVDTGDQARAAFQTTGEFHSHLPTLGERVKICRARIDAETLLTVPAFFPVKGDVAVLVILKGIQCQFFRDLHEGISRIRDIFQSSRPF